MRIYIKIISCLVLSTPSFANVMDLLSLEHFYVGAALGIGALSDHITTSTPSEANQVGALGFIGGGLVGYDFKTEGPIKYTLEGYYYEDTSTGTVRNNQAATSFKIKKKHDLGIRFTPGYEWLPCFVTGLVLGYTQGTFNTSDTPDNNSLVSHGVYGLLPSRDFNRKGFVLGLSFKSQISHHFSIRLNGVYTAYTCYKAAGLQSLGDSVGDLMNLYGNNLQSIDTDVVLTYAFA